MPKERVYRFMTTSADQNATSQEFKREVRSHAASASCSHRSTRHGRVRYQGEGVIRFQRTTSNITAACDSEVPAPAAHTRKFVILAEHHQPTERTQSISDNQSNPGHELPDDNTLQDPYRLHTSSLSGNGFSPLQHLATYHAPYVPGVLNHYIFNLTIPIPELDGSSTIPHFRAAWLPVVLHDPVVFQVIVLFAATHYASIAHPSQYKGLRTELLSLKQFALLALIQTVQSEQTLDTRPSSTDQGRESRDALIAGAVKMASYEAIFGSREAFHLHMTTVRRLLRSQGGPDTLGIKGFLARLLSFVDTNSAFLLGTKPYLVEFGLSNRRSQSQPSGEEWYHKVPPQFRGSAKCTKVVDLERFLGLMPVSVQMDRGS